MYIIFHSLETSGLESSGSFEMINNIVETNENNGIDEFSGGKYIFKRKNKAKMNHQNEVKKI